MRQADELSITVTPAAANRGAWTRDIVAPAENNAMSKPCGSAVAASSTSISCPGMQSSARRPRGGEVPTCVGRKLPLVQQRAHHPTDLAGRANHTAILTI